MMKLEVIQNFQCDIVISVGDARLFDRFYSSIFVWRTLARTLSHKINYRITFTVEGHRRRCMRI